MVAICDFIFFYGYVKNIEYLLVIKKKKYVFRTKYKSLLYYHGICEE